MASPARDRPAFKNFGVAEVDSWNPVSHSFLFDRPAKTTSNGRRGLSTKEKQSTVTKERGGDLDRQSQLMSH